MKYIKTFDTFSINEALGLAEPTLACSDFLTKEFEEQYELFEDYDGNKYKEDVNYSKDDLSDIINKKNWVDMPISSLSVKFEFERMSDEAFAKKYYKTVKIKNWNSGGACYGIDKKEENTSYIDDPINDRVDHSVHLKMEISAYVAESFTDVDGMVLEVESAIIHELNHAYETYKRTKRMSQFSTDVTWSLDANPKVKKEIWKVWAESIGYYLYWSERHEINAMTQEAWPYVKRYDLKELKEKSSSWRFANYMTEFNVEDFKKEMTDVISKYYTEDDVDFILTRMKDGLANMLIRNRMTSIEDAADKPSLSGEKIKNMDIDQFLDFVEKRTNSAGEKLKKRIMRLYSLKSQQYD